MDTRPTRPSGDLLKVLEAITGLRGDVQGLKDAVQAGHMRSDALAERLSQAEAQIETVLSEVAKVEQKRANTAAEMLATQTQGYRQFDKRLDDLGDRIDAHGVDVVRTASEGAAAGGAKGAAEIANENAGRNRKLALTGIVLGGAAAAGTLGSYLAKGIALIQALAHVKVGAE